MAREIEAKIVLDGEDRTGKMWLSATKNLKTLTDGALRLSGAMGLPKLSGALGNVAIASGRVVNAMRPAIAAIGTLTGIAATGGIAGFVAGLKASAVNIDEISKKATQLGMDFQELREFAYVAAQQDIEWRKLADGLTQASSGYASIHMHTGRLYTQLGKISPALRSQIEHAKSASEAYNIMFGAIHRALEKGDKATAQKLSEMFFGDADFTKIGELSGEQVIAGRKKASKDIGVLTKEQADQIDKLGDSVDRFKWVVGGVFDAAAVEALPKLTPLIDSMSNLLVENRGAIAKVIGDAVGDISNWANSVDWKGFGSSLHDVWTNIDSAVTGTVGWAHAIEGLAVAPLIMPVLGLAFAVGRLGWALASTPAGALLAIGAAAAYVGWQNWDSIGEHFTKAGNAWEEAGRKFQDKKSLEGFKSLQLASTEMEAGLDAWVQKLKEATGLDKIQAQADAMEKAIGESVKSWWASVEAGWTTWSENFRTSAFNLGKDLMLSMANGIADMAMAPVNAASGVADDLFKRFKGWFLPQPQYPQVYGPHGIPQLPNVKLHAKGGPVSAGGWSIVGEQGPELVHWGSNGQVINAAATAALTSPLAAASAGAAFARAMSPPFERLAASVETLARLIGGSEIATGGGGFGGAGFGRSGLGGGGGYGAPAGISAKSLGSSKNAGSWMNFLMNDMGAPKWLASAAVAGLMGESGVNLNSGAVGDGGTSGGTAQWHNERWAGLRKLAAGMGKPWTDIGAQQAWFKHEMQTKYAHVWKRMLASGNAYGALDAYVRGYEVPANPGGEVRKRSGYVPGLLSGSWQPVAKTMEPQTTAQPIPQPVNIGQGKLNVKIKVHGPGSVSGIESVSPENLSVSAGVDNSGRRLWRPHPGQA